MKGEERELLWRYKRTEAACRVFAQEETFVPFITSVMISGPIVFL